jgi:hypothetical protein
MSSEQPTSTTGSSQPALPSQPSHAAVSSMPVGVNTALANAQLVTGDAATRGARGTSRGGGAGGDVQEQGTVDESGSLHHHHHHQHQDHPQQFNDNNNVSEQGVQEQRDVEMRHGLEGALHLDKENEFDDDDDAAAAIAAAASDRAARLARETSAIVENDEIRRAERKLERLREQQRQRLQASAARVSQRADFTVAGDLDSAAAARADASRDLDASSSVEEGSVYKEVASRMNDDDSEGSAGSAKPRRSSRRRTRSQSRSPLDGTGSLTGDRRKRHCSEHTRSMGGSEQMNVAEHARSFVAREEATLALQAAAVAQPASVQSDNRAAAAITAPNSLTSNRRGSNAFVNGSGENQGDLLAALQMDPSLLSRISDMWRREKEGFLAGERAESSLPLRTVSAAAAACAAAAADPSAAATGPSAAAAAVAAAPSNDAAVTASPSAAAAEATANFQQRAAMVTRQPIAIHAPREENVLRGVGEGTVERVLSQQEDNSMQSRIDCRLGERSGDTAWFSTAELRACVPLVADRFGISLFKAGELLRNKTVYHWVMEFGCTISEVVEVLLAEERERGAPQEHVHEHASATQQDRINSAMVGAGGNPVVSPAERGVSLSAAAVQTPPLMDTIDLTRDDVTAPPSVIAATPVVLVPPSTLPAMSASERANNRDVTELASQLKVRNSLEATERTLVQAAGLDRVAGPHMQSTSCLENIPDSLLSTSQRGAKTLIEQAVKEWRSTIRDELPPKQRAQGSSSVVRERCFNKDGTPRQPLDDADAALVQERVEFVHKKAAAVEMVLTLCQHTVLAIVGLCPPKVALSAVAGVSQTATINDSKFRTAAGKVSHEMRAACEISTTDFTVKDPLMALNGFAATNTLLTALEEFNQETVAKWVENLTREWVRWAQRHVYDFVSLSTRVDTSTKIAAQGNASSESPQGEKTITERVGGGRRQRRRCTEALGSALRSRHGVR